MHCRTILDTAGVGILKRAGPLSPRTQDLRELGGRALLAWAKNRLSLPAGLQPRVGILGEKRPGPPSPLWPLETFEGELGSF